MAIRLNVKYPNELSVQPYAVWDAASFNTISDLTPVTSWLDWYASGRNLTYVGTVKAPFVSTLRLNGNKVIECDAVDSRLRLTSPSYTTDFSFSIVCKLVSPAVSGFRIFDFGFSLRFNNATSFSLATTAGLIAGISFGDPYNWSVITISRSGSTVNVYYNLKLVSTFTNSDTLYTPISAFGDNNSFGVGTFMKAYIAEMHTFNYAMTAADALANQRYLKLKWGV